MKNLTEREIIRVLTSRFDHTSHNPLGFNDDVSAIPLSSKEWIIVKTDMLVASTDVPPGMTNRQAARKAVVATVSDFAAKGVQPQALMVSLGIPRPARAKDVHQIASGLKQAANEYSCKIIGGDTNQAKDLVMDIIGIGIANPQKLVRRNGARPGDIVAVTGPFGESAAGLKILTSRRKKESRQYRSLVNAVLRPQARLTAGIALAKTGGITSSIDSSDGLALSLHQLAEASNVDIKLHTVPLSSTAKDFATEHRISALDLALYGGEEYELVVTTKKEKFAALQKQVPTLNKIGTVEKRRIGVSAHVGGRKVLVKAEGWEHFT